MTFFKTTKSPYLLEIQDKFNWLNDWLLLHSPLKHSQQTQTKQQFPHTLSCSSKFKVGAVSRVASSSASAHMEDIDGRGSEASYHHAGGFGPCGWVAQLLLLLEKQHQIIIDENKCQFRQDRETCFCINPLSQQRLNKNIIFILLLIWDDGMVHTSISNISFLYANNVHYSVNSDCFLCNHWWCISAALSTVTPLSTSRQLTHTLSKQIK